MDKTLFDYAMTFGGYNTSLPKGFQNISIDDGGRHQFSTDYLKYDYRIINANGTQQTTTLSSQLWHDPLAVLLTASASTTLNVVYTSDVVPAVSKADRLFVVVQFKSATAFGVLNQDFKVQVRYNGTGSWYEVPMEEISYNAGYGKLTSATEFSNPTATSVQFRILANGKNAFTINSLGFMTE